MPSPASRDEVAVVTGAASGFGRALAAQFAAQGLRVAMLDLDGERAAGEAAAVAAQTGVEAMGSAVDVASNASVTAAVAAVTDRFGRADVVVSNVGVQLFGAVERLTDDEWRWVLDVNVIGAARTVRAFLPLLRRAAGGRLAFTTSSSVLAPGSRMAAYQASKFALWGLAETLRHELADDGISVSVIFPSGMMTRHLETSEAAQPDQVRRPIADEEDFAAMVRSAPSMTRDVATAEDAARGVADQVLHGEPYIVTHGDLVDAVQQRGSALEHAARAARDKEIGQAG